MRYLLTIKKKQNFSSFSNCRYCADRAKNLPVSRDFELSTNVSCEESAVSFVRG